MTAHVRAIHLDSGLDPYVGIPVADLAPQALQHKMIDRRRGGFCFEQNGLLAAVLESIGYDVVPLAGRVVWMRTPDQCPPETHKLLNVGIPGESSRYIVDVGFGGCTHRIRCSFALDEPQPTDLEEFRIVAVDPREPPARSRGGRPTVDAGADRRRVASHVPVHTGATTPDRLAGRIMVRLNISGLTFRRGATAAIVTESSRLNLSGPQLTEHHRDGRTVKDHTWIGRRDTVRPRRPFRYRRRRLPWPRRTSGRVVAQRLTRRQLILCEKPGDGSSSVAVEFSALCGLAGLNSIISSATCIRSSRSGR